MWPEHYKINVSRESFERLQLYEKLLKKWQSASNLVSGNTLDEVWVRHFADCAQLSAYIQPRDVSQKIVLADIGSGAGFPGLVLAMLRNDIDFHLVESDERKCAFLRSVSRETKLSESDVHINVHNSRIESALAGINPDIVTARALASLNSLLMFVKPCLKTNPDLTCVFLKGRRYGDELEEARRHFDFELQEEVSLTDSQARILILRAIRLRKE